MQSSPLSQRISFLEKKGLTPDEISEAMSRAEVAAVGGGFDRPAEEPLWKKLLIPGGLLAAGLGVVGATRARDSSAFKLPQPPQPGLPGTTLQCAAAGNVHVTPKYCL